MWDVPRQSEEIQESLSEPMRAKLRFSELVYIPTWLLLCGLKLKEKYEEIFSVYRRALMLKNPDEGFPTEHVCIDTSVQLTLHLNRFIHLKLRLVFA